MLRAFVSEWWKITDIGFSRLISNFLWWACLPLLWGEKNFEKYRQEKSIRTKILYLSGACECISFFISNMIAHPGRQMFPFFRVKSLRFRESGDWSGNHEAPNLSRHGCVPSHLVCWVHKNSHRAIACGWPPAKITGGWIALFSPIRFKDYARELLSPKIISFYWFSKLTPAGVSWAKLKLSYSQAQGFLLSGKRFLSLWELYCFLPLREAILRRKESCSKQIFQNSFYLTKTLSSSPWCGTFKTFIGFPSF